MCQNVMALVTIEPSNAAGPSTVKLLIFGLGGEIHTFRLVFFFVKDVLSGFRSVQYTKIGGSCFSCFSIGKCVKSPFFTFKKAKLGIFLYKWG